MEFHTGEVDTVLSPRLVMVMGSTVSSLIINLF